MSATSIATQHSSIQKETPHNNTPPKMSPAEAHKPGFLKKARFNVFKFHALLLGLLASLCYASDLGVFGTLQQAAKIVGINDPVTPHHMRTAGLMLLMAMFANIVAAWPNFFQSFFGKFIKLSPAQAIAMIINLTLLLHYIIEAFVYCTVNFWMVVVFVGMVVINLLGVRLSVKFK